MSLIRLLTLLALVWVGWLMIKNYLHKNTKAEKIRKVTARRIVKCQYCDVHLPEQEALQYDSRWFCTQAHKQAFLGNNKS